MSNSSIYRRGYNRVDPFNTLSRQELIGRGWTIAAVSRFLGEPDLETKGRYSNSVCHRYSRDRVNEVESTEEFKQWLEKTNERRTRESESISAATQKRKVTLQRNRDALIADAEQSLVSLVLELPPATSYESIREWVGSQSKGVVYISAEKVVSTLRAQILAQALPLVTRIKDVEKRNTIIRDYVREQIKCRYGKIAELADVIQD